MYKAISVLFVTLAVTYFVSASSLKGSSTGVVVVHATSNSSVPSVDYIVNAVESLKQAFDVFPTEDKTAELYSALFKTKYPDKIWNVAVGYTTLYINSSIFVETQVTQGGKQLKDDKSKGKLYMIFSTN